MIINDDKTIEEASLLGVVVIIGVDGKTFGVEVERVETSGVVCQPIVVLLSLPGGVMVEVDVDVVEVKEVVVDSTLPPPIIPSIQVK